MPKSCLPVVARLPGGNDFFNGFAVLGAARPNAFGTAIGALFVGILLQGMTMMNAPYYIQDFVKGAVLVAALVFTFYLSSRRTGAGH